MMDGFENSNSGGGGVVSSKNTKLITSTTTAATSSAATTTTTTKKIISTKKFLSSSVRTSSITTEESSVGSIACGTESELEIIKKIDNNNNNNNNNNKIKQKKNIINSMATTKKTSSELNDVGSLSTSSLITTPNNINENNMKKLIKNINDDDLMTNTGSVTSSVKKKTKKIKKSIDGKENISVKSSFSKFDALQKKNILNIRSSDSSKAQEKFNESEREPNCRSCGKIVYKMEEIKAERNIWHKNCFKCQECNKQLNVDTFESHGSVLYCKPHFKLLFAPKAVEDNEPVKPKKPELIIRENQPIELPPDVVRASDKPDLGLEELQQLNVKSRFQMFENYQEQQQKDIIERGNGVKRSATILSKLAKFNAKGMNTGVNDDILNDIQYDDSNSDNNYTDDDDDDIKKNDNDYDHDLIRAKRAQRERPIHFDQMNDIKTKFENGHIQSREERREERKQEIQNIRSRLFMGKQARIKEQYQQAVAESEQGKTSVGKKPEIEIGDKAKSIKEKFEKGEIFRDYNEDGNNNSRVQDDEMAVFESGIGKQSRSLFMELDATATKSPQLSSNPSTPRTPDPRKQPFTGENIIKYDEKQDDIKIETSEISSKFKFFETYKPKENHKKEFRITPPRDGVVKMPSPDDNDINQKLLNNNNNNNNNKNDDNDQIIVAEEQHTATKMLSKFREMEQRKNRWQNPNNNNNNNNNNDYGLKPLKQFTPPPDNNHRVYSNNDDDDDDEDDDDDDDDDDEYEEVEEEEEIEEENDNNKYQSARYNDEFLKAAQSAARAKLLRAKFEKWEANEIKREMRNGQIEVYDNSEESQVESAKTLKAKFESMKDQTHLPDRPKVQVNRFV